MKKLISVSASLVFVILLSVSAFAYENIVDDGAMLFSQNEIEEIEWAISDFSSQTDFSLAVVTTDDAEYKTSEEFADDYHDDLIDNQMWSENSILFLIDMDNREVYISTTGNAINEYSDYDIENIIDGGYNYLTDGDYAQCIIEMTSSAIDIYGSGGYYGNDNFIYDDNYNYGYNDGNYYVTEIYDDYYYYGSGPSYSSGFDFGDFIVYFVISLVIALVAVIAVKSKYKNYGKGDEFNEDDISLELTASNDNVVSRNVVTARIPRNNHKPGGGGVSSGGSRHTSSAGRSHGGGGRSF